MTKKDLTFWLKSQVLFRYEIKNNLKILYLTNFYKYIQKHLLIILIQKEIKFTNTFYNLI